LLRDIELNGERNRGLFVLKSRGMAHSNQIREFLLTEQGVDLLDVYVGADGVLTGSARAAQEAQDKVALQARRQEVERKRRELERKRQALEGQMTALRGEIESMTEEIRTISAEEITREQVLADVRVQMERLRQADKES